MLLCDQIAQGAYPSIASDAVTTAVPLKRGFLSDAVTACPIRYVLHDHAFDACLLSATHDADCIVASLRDLRAPYPLMWIEWREPARATSDRRSAGILVQANDGGRSGHFYAIWNEPQAGLFRAPMRLAFDFDCELSDGLAHIGADRDDPLFAPYDKMLKHAALQIERDWLDRLRAIGVHTSAGLRSAEAALLQANGRDLPLLSAFLLMLDLRAPFETRACDRHRLNRARARHGKAPLLDHIEVLVRTPQVGAGSQNGERVGPRRHWVRGHLVRRDDKTFWRRSHVRGDLSLGIIRSKTLVIERLA